jgi:hypothetical protein
MVICGKLTILHRTLNYESYTIAVKTVLFNVLLFISAGVSAQVLNPSFENGSGGDLTGWQWTCNAQSFNNAPPACGSWSIKVWSGNAQGCLPGYAYQKLPDITNGQTFELSGWSYAELAPPVGIFFGKINNGTITLQSGDTTSNTSWTRLNVQSTYLLGSGDTAVVVLYGGLIGGPAQGYGYFDSLNLRSITAISEPRHNQNVKIFPNPIKEYCIIQNTDHLNNANLLLYNSQGLLVKSIENLNGRQFALTRDGLCSGIYFLVLKNHLQEILTIQKISIE